MGCDDLLVITDHKPLTKIFGDRTLDEITNSRLFSFKQQALPWHFEIEHMPGCRNFFSDAASRNPTNPPDEEDDDDNIDDVLAAIHKPAITNLRSITWDIVRDHTTKDVTMVKLVGHIQRGFPDCRQKLEAELMQYWDHRDNLLVIDDVVLLNERVVIPPSLRQEALQSLHAAHQGTTSMIERAKTGIFWPGITSDIQRIRQHCSSCNRSAPSQPKTPLIEPWIPSTPFESIACDYFHFRGFYYFVAADRLSGWTEQSRIKSGTDEARSKGLC